MADPINPLTNPGQSSQPNQSIPTPPSTAGQPSSLGEQQIRMMRGDLGAPAPKPAAPTFAEASAGKPAQPIPMAAVPPQAAKPAEPKLNIPPVPAVQVPVKPLFDSDEPVFTPNTVVPPTGKAAPLATSFSSTPVQPINGGASVDALIARQQGKKKMGMIIGGVLGLIVLGGAGWYLYPKLMQPAEVVTPTPSTPVTAVAPSQPVPPPKPAFNSLFTVDPVKRSTVVLPTSTPLTSSVINSTLKTEAAAAGSAEVLLMKDSQTSLSFEEIIGALAPSLKAKTAPLFTGMVTSYVYSDESGNWPGYIAKVNASSTPEEIKSWFAALEKTSEKKNFFIAAPGTFQAFKNGVINNTYPDRYATAATKGASLGYLILPENQVIVISTSYAGMRDGLRLLGH